MCAYGIALWILVMETLFKTPPVSNFKVNGENAK